jgi:nucleotide-binding universal stress UspA family protein
VLPLDGSDAGERALPTASALARLTNAALSIVHVFVPPVSAIPGAVIDGGVLESMEEEAARYVDDVRGRFTSVLPARCTVELLRARPPVGLLGGTSAVLGALGRYVKRQNADLIVLTSHGRGGISRAWLGSVTDGVIRRSGVPVLVVRPEAVAREGGYRHIVVPLDGSGLAEQMLPRALAIARLLRARVTLLRVLVPLLALARPSPVSRPDAADLVRQQGEAERYLERARRRLTSAGPATIDTAIVVDANPARAILEYAASHDVDLVALTTHGRGAAGRLMIGSVADKVLRGAGTDVLVYHPQSS